MFILGWALLAAALSVPQLTKTAVHDDPSMVDVGPGTYRPLYPASPDGREIRVPAFRLDRVAVTNADFLTFVRSHPEWRRDRVSPLLVDERYLAAWAAPDALGEGVDPRQPVVDVSWFAARAYCASAGKQLPTTAEWELAAAASDAQADASSDAAWKAHLLDLYTRAAPARLPRVGTTRPNFWGVQDLHGVIWEWVQDFEGSSGVSEDSRRLCVAGGTQPWGDKTDFAAFEREAMRSALRARYTTANLGFRCASADAPSQRTADVLYDLHPTLRDQNGTTLPIDAFRGHPVLVSMFYGSCPSACPLLISNIARIDAELPREVRADTRVMLVSFDAEHDTPQALRAIADAHQLDLARWELAAAPDGDGREIARFLGITYRKLPGGGYSHDSVITAFDAQGRMLARVEGPDADPTPIVQALRGPERRHHARPHGLQAARISHLLRE